ncbi:hypothetical protein BL253_24360 [Pseudofrankia asymbiotica]|uniref:Thioesterase domain-containing protein n=1 Tax=Pseudofrankia asymbiotica TaxID=1834516 RepID=A0A1V2I6S9_9ACTN|nr:hypothetical protein BL253_24360 [Pseudofrankia asymbiotica]
MPAAGERPSRTVLTTLTVPSRFCGPPGSADGGYVGGRLAGYLDGPVTVTLRRPPPLAVPMAVEVGPEGSVRVRRAGTLIAEAAPSQDRPALWVPDTVSMAEARAAEGQSRYFQRPEFQTCFVCGTHRGRGDGLRIFPGLVRGRPLWAAPWTPDASSATGGPSVRPEIAWAALGCPGGIAAIEAHDIGEDAAVLLGQMTADVPTLPVAGHEYQVVAWSVRREGRRLIAGSALLGQGGEVLAAARTVWLTVQRQVPRMTVGMPEMS